MLFWGENEILCGLKGKKGLYDLNNIFLAFYYYYFSLSIIYTNSQ